LKTIRKYYDLLFSVVEYVCVFFQVAMVCILASGVFMRYVMNISPRWTDEIGIFCMIWFSLMGAAVALKENRHIRIDFWNEILPPKVVKIMDLIVHVIVLLFMCWFLTQAIALTKLTAATKLAGSGLPLRFEYIAEPIAVVLMIIAAIGRIGEIIGRKS